MAHKRWWADRRRDRWDRLMSALAESNDHETHSDSDPFKILVATLISLRTRDEVTDAAAARLFALADTPEKIAALDEQEIAVAIKPTNFYWTKARRIRAIAKRLVEEHYGKVPSELETLLTFEGVGLKTANLVLSEGFGLPAVCVDTHVHRVTNRLGLVKTRNAKETEEALRAVLPKEYWRHINPRLVSFGQRVCRPVSPICSRCPLVSWCRRSGVRRSR